MIAVENLFSNEPEHSQESFEKFKLQVIQNYSEADLDNAIKKMYV